MVRKYYILSARNAATGRIHYFDNIPFMPAMSSTSHSSIIFLPDSRKKNICLNAIFLSDGGKPKYSLSYQFIYLTIVPL